MHSNEPVKRRRAQRPWTTHEVEKAIALYQTHTVGEIAKQLGRSAASVGRILGRSTQAIRNVLWERVASYKRKQRSLDQRVRELHA